MIIAYWQIGREIVEEEQRGKKRAGYGEALLERLSQGLLKEFGRGYSVRNLRLIRQFYIVYKDRVGGIRDTQWSDSGVELEKGADRPSLADGRDRHNGKNEIRQSVIAESGCRIREKRIRPSVSSISSSQEGRGKDHGPSSSGSKVDTNEGITIYTAGRETTIGASMGFQSDLSWTHYLVLIRIENPMKRRFYEVECSKARWSVRELERQVSALLYERLARSRDKKAVLSLAEKGHEVYNPEDLIKDPYVLEFTGLPEASKWQESDLETALIDRLQKFLLELGKDLFFVSRQKRITIDGDHFYIDLVFYHRLLRCYLLIDLKVGKLTQADIGQMLLYTGYFEEVEQANDENPPIGLILCTDKNEAVVRYTLSRSASKVFASRYQLHLPTEEELADELVRERNDHASLHRRRR